MRTMILKNKLIGILCLVLAGFAITSCDDDDEDFYYSYGIAKMESGNTGWSILTDKGNVLIPENLRPLSWIKDSTRVILHYTIDDEKDKNTFEIDVFSIDTLLTKNILPYDETQEDSIGNDPAYINAAWIAHDFLTLDFTYQGNYPQPDEKHMVNVIEMPSENADEVILEFRHNAFKDNSENNYRGIASFRLKTLSQKDYKKVIVRYYPNNNADDPKTIEIKVNEQEKE